MPQKITGLIVEDSLDDFDLLRESLTSSREIDMTIIHRGRLADAIAAAGESVIDVAILDLTLPDSVGLETYTAFHAAHPSIPTVIMTGIKDYDMATRAVHRGAQDYLFKGEPSATAIVRTIRYAIERQRARRDLELTVARRTAELSSANALLNKKIGELNAERERRKQSDAILKNIFDGILDPLFVLDRHAKIRTMNRAALEYYGAGSLSAVIGKLCYRVLRQRNTPCDGCEIPRQLNRGRYCAFERQGLTGPFRFEQVVIYPLNSPTGEAQACIVRIQDTTQQKQLEKQIIRSEKMASLGTLVSSIAHEINNPNNFISFNIPILKDYLQEILPIVDDHAGSRSDFEVCCMPYAQLREDLFNLIDNIENGSARINAFVTNLREYTNASPQPRVRLQIKDAIEKALAMCRTQIEKAVKTFTTVVPDALPPITTEPHAFEQVLINLLLNAAQAADKTDSWIELNVGATENADGSCIEVTVTDNGCGIDEAQQLKIFDPFFTTKPPDEGTGLGLYVCHTLADRLGWRIEVSSRPGTGSRFALLLPVDQAAETA